MKRIKDPYLEKKDIFIVQQNKANSEGRTIINDLNNEDAEYPPEEIRKHVQRHNIKKGLLKKDPFFEKLVRKGQMELLSIGN